MTAIDLNHVRRGNFIWCLKIHEDNLRSFGDAQVIIQTKASGEEERVRQYLVQGKRRPALVLLASPDCRDVLVWYTHTDLDRRATKWIDVTPVTQPRGEKKSFLNPEGREVRRIPRTAVWCGSEIDMPNKAVAIGWLERASKIPIFRI